MRQLLNGAEVVLGAIYVFFLPGFVLTYLFFKRKDKDTDIIERLALSFALSVAVVPLVAFYLNLAGVKISRTHILMEVLGIIVISLAGIGLRAKKRGKDGRYKTGR